MHEKDDNHQQGRGKIFVLEERVWNYILSSFHYLPSANISFIYAFHMRLPPIHSLSVVPSGLRH